MDLFCLSCTVSVEWLCVCWLSLVCVAAGLEGKKVEAEAYIDKQAERLKWNITGNTLLQRDKEVSTHTLLTPTQLCLCGGYGQEQCYSVILNKESANGLWLACTLCWAAQESWPVSLKGPVWIACTLRRHQAGKLPCCPCGACAAGPAGGQ